MVSQVEGEKIAQNEKIRITEIITKRMTITLRGRGELCKVFDYNLARSRRVIDRVGL